VVLKMKWRLVAVVGLAVPLVLLSGCFFNIFQTARTVGQGNVALTVGSGALSITVGQDTSWVFTPQAMLTVGLADSVDLSVRSGAMIGASGEPGFLGVVGDIKVALIQAPDSLSFALGIGGGYSPGLLGWGVEASVYLDSNLRFLPIYFVYRPFMVLGGEEYVIQNQFAGGLHLMLSPNARILIELDSWAGLLSAGICLSIIF